MSGINKAMGTALLNTLTCNDGDMYNGTGSGQTLYKFYANKSVLEDYSYNNRYYVTPYRYEGVTTVPSEYHPSGDLLGYVISEAATPVITESYIGLLVEAPQYYIGSNTTHPTQSLINRENPVAFETKTFLNVHEIPNRDHGGLLSNTSAQAQHYWDGYARVKLSSLKKNTSTGKYECDYTILSGAQIEEDYTVTGNYCYANSKLVTKNTSSIFLGLNTSSYAWPAIKYFGLFRKESDVNNLYLYATSTQSTDYYWIETTPDLYMWGELQEKDNWYHTWTYSASEWTTKWSTLYINTGTTQSPNYVLNESDQYDSSKTYYEKLGVIIEPDYGATFSPNAFNLIFENSIYEV